VDPDRLRAALARRVNGAGTLAAGGIRGLSRRRGLMYALLGLAAALAILFGLNAVYGFLNSSSGTGGSQRTATVTTGTVQASVSASGNVSVATSAAANFGTSGTLTAVNAKVGEHVKAGQVLAKLDPSAAQSNLQVAEANLAQAQSTLATAKAGLTESQKQSNAATLQQAESQVSSAKEQLVSDQTAVATAQKQLSSDRALGCPPAGSTSSGTSAASSSSGASSSSTSSSASSTNSGSTSSSSGLGSSTSSRKSADATPGTTTGSSAATSSGPSVPSAVTGSATTVGSTTATVTGTVDPSGAETTYVFQYGTSASSLASQTASLSAGSGSADVSVTENLSGLKAGATYWFRLTATNAQGTVDGAETSFQTSTAAKPAVVTSSASNVLTKTATLNGTVDPNGSATTYRFEYGTTTAYGKKTATVSAGSGTAAAQVSAAIGGLKPDTAYLFRLVATNSSGKSVGIGEVVKTSASSCVDDAATISTDKQAVTAQRATVQTAESSLAQTKSTIAASATPSATTLAQDQAAIVQDEATVTTDKQALAQTTLTAPVAGTVTAVNDSVGDTISGTGSSVSRGASASSSSSSSSGLGASSASSNSSSSSSSFITIETLDKLEVVTGFPEADATKLAVGQPATVTFPALTNVEVAGKVTAISSTSTVVSNVVTYDATITLVNPPADVKDGMTANVSVVTQTRAHVLELPSSAITTTGTVSTVSLLQNGKTTVTRVVTGLVGSSSTEIVSGVAAGDVVVLPTVSITAASSTATTSSGFGGFAGTGGGGFAGGGFGGRGGG